MPRATDPPALDPNTLMRADAALAALAGDYLKWAEADVARLAVCLGDARTDAGGRRDHLARMFSLAHDMKGQGGTFGYDLVTEIGARLCRLLDGRPEPDAADWDRLTAHVNALSRVLTEQLAGDGGQSGQTLLAGL